MLEVQRAVVATLVVCFPMHVVVRFIDFALHLDAQLVYEDTAFRLQASMTRP